MNYKLSSDLSCENKYTVYSQLSVFNEVEETRVIKKHGKSKFQVHMVHTNVAHKNNNNNTTPMFVGLNNTKKTRMPQEKKKAQERIKSYVLKQMYFSLDKNAIALKYYDLRTSAVWQF
jgi:hypothetical protein